MTVQYHGQTPRLSEATVANGFVFLAGMVPERTDADATAQTRDVLAQIDKWLAECGSDKRHILEATIFLPDLNNYDAMNQAWDEWVAPGRAPARACVEAKLANPDWAVEIKVSAVQIRQL
ncbi:RidA family protein [Uruburuella testudinis]|uniref:RidA family protein n=1 Tax=Uruburuella testudinis TaxID=1282863 RepID=A0ABY4DW75_9NEIS|nr:RidA family protein [Uruburuella testudinis]UOO82882.1 RidA family protein [Uruburuella testudinis]